MFTEVYTVSLVFGSLQPARSFRGGRNCVLLNGRLCTSFFGDRPPALFGDLELPGTKNLLPLENIMTYFTVTRLRLNSTSPRTFCDLEQLRKG